MNESLTAACSLTWLDDDGVPQSATIGDPVTVPARIAADLPHAFRETGGPWVCPPPAHVADLDRLRRNVTDLVESGFVELEPALAEIAAAILERESVPLVDPDQIPLSLTPDQLREAGASAKVIAKAKTLAG